MTDTNTDYIVNMKTLKESLYKDLHTAEKAKNPVKVYDILTLLSAMTCSQLESEVYKEHQTKKLQIAYSDYEFGQLLGITNIDNTTVASPKNNSQTLTTTSEEHHQSNLPAYAAQVYHSDPSCSYSTELTSHHHHSQPPQPPSPKPPPPPPHNSTTMAMNNTNNYKTYEDRSSFSSGLSVQPCGDVQNNYVVCSRRQPTDDDATTTVQPQDIEQDRKRGRERGGQGYNAEQQELQQKRQNAYGGYNDPSTYWYGNSTMQTSFHPQQQQQQSWQQSVGNSYQTYAMPPYFHHHNNGSNGSYQNFTTADAPAQT
jgi:hypothetical protein